ncbi:MAG TPA: hypothetical protein VIH90_03335 [Candidatus Saccharimonadales bacterium]
MMKFGCKPPKNAPTLRLKNFLTGIVPDHPISADYLARLNKWQMLGNDQYGDCVAVTLANIYRLLSFVLGGEEKYLTIDQVIEIYKTQNPGFPAEDNGMDIQTLLEYLVKNPGKWGITVIGFAKVDLSNQEEFDAAIGIGGCVWTGIYVQQVNMTQFQAKKPWDYSPLSQTIGGHSIVSGGYNNSRPGALAGYYDMITYAEETSYTKNFLKYLGMQGWFVIFKEHLGTKAFIEGMDMIKFSAAYKAITGSDFPVIVNPTPIPDPPVPTPAISYLVTAISSGQLKLKNKSDVSAFNKGTHSL